MHCRDDALWATGPTVRDYVRVLMFVIQSPQPKIVIKKIAKLEEPLSHFSRSLVGYLGLEYVVGIVMRFKESIYVRGGVISRPSGNRVAD
jgi:hypothetical protein